MEKIMKINRLLIVLIAFLFPASAQAQTIDFFKDQMVSINKKAKWKLFSEHSGSREFYYDEKNIQPLTGGSVIVAVKTIYKSKDAINKMIYERRRNQPPGFTDGLNYENFASSLEILEINCSMNNFDTQAIKADFDTKDHLLNIFSDSGGNLPVIANTPIARLYSIVCRKGLKN